jgi:hypothetical protein
MFVVLLSGSVLVTYKAFSSYLNSQAPSLEIFTHGFAYTLKEQTVIMMYL